MLKFDKTMNITPAPSAKLQLVITQQTRVFELYKRELRKAGINIPARLVMYPDQLRGFDFETIEVVFLHGYRYTKVFEDQHYLGVMQAFGVPMKQYIT